MAAETVTVLHLKLLFNVVASSSRSRLKLCSKKRGPEISPDWLHKGRDLALHIHVLHLILISSHQSPREASILNHRMFFTGAQPLCKDKYKFS